MLSNTKTIFKGIVDQLANTYDLEESKNLAYLLMEEVAGLSKTDILAEKTITASEGINQKIEKILRRLLAHEPIQYIFGKAAFYGLDLSVNEHVLIPRQETEELVDWIIKSNHNVERILDIGTGSGCIPIALARGYPSSEIHAWDVSAGALEVATRNAAINDVRIHFQQVDVLSNLPTGQFDLIVSNPPYVLEKEKNEMHSNVLDHEPEAALFVPDHDPLLFYRTISQLSEGHLKPGGWLYFEINEKYGHETASLMKENHFVEIEIRQDLNRKDRMVRGCRPTDQR